MRIFVDNDLRAGNSNLSQHVYCVALRFFLLHIQMQPDSFDHLMPYRKHRIKRCHGFLKNHRYFVSSNISHIALAFLGQISSVKEQGAINDPAFFTEQPHD
ncbi:hypothetical protein D3C71_1519570 [compost metagenome]